MKDLYYLYVVIGGLKYRVDSTGLPVRGIVFCRKIAERTARSLIRLGFEVEVRKVPTLHHVI